MYLNCFLPKTVAFLHKNHALSDEEIHQLEKVSFRKAYTKKEVIIQQGEVQTDLLFVRSGV
jgi:CRP-like cAMP-binding protein